MQRNHPRHLPVMENVDINRSCLIGLLQAVVEGEQPFLYEPLTAA
ncbi:hypothetical protein [Methanogenium organophilum]|uniref:Uncharacterized protein n=1 Tax=Methanogenium organophilum TaxID=2199 RepID=A0A9X9S6Z2_METOG|nr:hypothetical protein [Methanogenium organophilum]WAI02000.1 hypothetical protein OU421_03775 [Methanogenium organophilum]